MGVIGTALSRSLVVLTLWVPGSVHAGDPPYAFVTYGIGQAVERARA